MYMYIRCSYTVACNEHFRLESTCTSKNTANWTNSCMCTCCFKKEVPMAQTVTLK